MLFDMERLTRKLMSAMQSCLGTLYQPPPVGVVYKEVLSFSFKTVMDRFHCLCSVITEVYESVSFRDASSKKRYRNIILNIQPGW